MRASEGVSNEAKARLIGKGGRIVSQADNASEGRKVSGRTRVLNTRGLYCGKAWLGVRDDFRNWLIRAA